MTSYTLTSAGSVVRSDGAFVPPDGSNTDWQAYQAWVAAGNTPTPVTAQVPAVPQVISDRQFFQQLAVQGVITQAEALSAVQTGTIPSEMQPLINALPATEQFAAQMQICGATQFERTDPLTLAIGQAYGWTAAQLDALWIAAAAL